MIESIGFDSFKYFSHCVTLQSVNNQLNMEICVVKNQTRKIKLSLDKRNLNKNYVEYKFPKSGFNEEKENPFSRNNSQLTYLLLSQGLRTRFDSKLGHNYDTKLINDKRPSCNQFITVQQQELNRFNKVLYFIQLYKVLARTPYQIWCTLSFGLIEKFFKLNFV